MRLCLLLSIACLLAACNSVDVQPVSMAGPKPKLVYIVANPEADQIAPELESAIDNGLQRHGIGTRLVQAAPVGASDCYLTYLAVSGWDMKPFLKVAEVHLKRGPKQIGFAHFQAGGGLSTAKFDSTPDKVASMMDQLLAGVR